MAGRLRRDHLISLAQKMLNKRHFASQPPYRATIDT
jgi:hypothetical protein